MAMTQSSKRRKKTRPSAEPKSLLKAKDHTEHATEVVEAAALELSTVNTSLEKEVKQSSQGSVIRKALDQSQEVENKVEQCADDLVSVNAALEEGIRERKGLHDELSKSNEALAVSRREARKAKSDSLHDPLTGLPNFTLFKDRLELALIQARRHNWRVAVMALDLDKFKQVNDTHGHAVGDLCLKEISDRLESVTRGDDTVCRRSGDEFQFLMIEAGEKPAVAAVAAKLAEITRGTCDLGGVQAAVTASIGIALFPDDGHSSQELLEKADSAMYACKREGSGPVFWNELGPVKPKSVEVPPSK